MSATKFRGGGILWYRQEHWNKIEEWWNAKHPGHPLHSPREKAPHDDSRNCLLVDILNLVLHYEIPPSWIAGWNDEVFEQRIFILSPGRPDAPFWTHL